MGFFSDLKEDLSQAVNELLPEEENVMAQGVAQEEQKTGEPATVQEVNLSDMLDKMEQEMGLISDDKSNEQAYVPEEPMDILGAAESILAGLDAPEIEQNTFVQAEPVEQPVVEQSFVTEPVATEEVVMPVVETPIEITAEPVREEIAAEPAIATLPEEPVVNVMFSVESVKEEIPANEESVVMPQEEKISMFEESKPRREATDENAVITAGMTIRGDVETEGSLELIGKVIGNVDVLGKLNVTGNIEGNSNAAEIYAERAHIVGELRSEGAVKIGQSSVIIGNIIGNSAVIAGAVKGDIDVKGPVILDTTAIVMGNIKSKSVQINNGAVIEGMCSQVYADVSPTTFFSELKNMGL